MSPITTPEELEALRRRYAPAGEEREPAVAQDHSGPPAGTHLAPEPPRAVWWLPRPRSGAAYTVAEVAELTGAAEATVRTWISRGLEVGYGNVRLRTLRAPRGRIAPGSLCRFLATVNGLDVELEREGARG
jgi:hypothetical protein